MANVLIKTCLQDATQHARRCPIPTLIRAYSNAARQFCTESSWLKRTLDGATEADRQVYSLGQDDENVLAICGIDAVSCGSGTQKRPLRPRDPRLWDGNRRPGKPTHYAYIPEAQIALHPVPNGTEPLLLTLKMTLQDGTASLPEDLLVKWHAAFTAGALEYLLNLPNEPWSNPLLAKKYEGVLGAAIANARADEQRAHNTGTNIARRPRLW